MPLEVPAESPIRNNARVANDGVGSGRRSVLDVLTVGVVVVALRFEHDDVVERGVNVRVDQAVRRAQQWVCLCFIPLLVLLDDKGDKEAMLFKKEDLILPLARRS